MGRGHYGRVPFFVYRGVDMTQKTIIDVSEHQGKINWTAVKQHIDGVIIRCGYGDDDKSQDDMYWLYNVRECERLGIPYGVYLYSYADTVAHIKSEIEHAKRLLKGHKPQYPVYIDLEEWPNGELATKAADMFCKAIKAAGYVAGVYSFESFYNQFMRGYNRYTLWIARYGANNGKPHEKPNIGTSYDAWQYTSNGRIGGYGGRLDVSYFYKTWTTDKPVQPSTTTATAAKVLEIARAEIGKDDGTKYGKWYEQNVDKDPNNYDFGGDDVPYCAMFVSWVFAKAGAKCAGLPGAYCPSMLDAAIKAKATTSVDKARPGDVVYFDWDGGETDHVGIVESNSGYNLTTIEGNTNNGEVKRKTHEYNCVVGVVRPSYGNKPSDNKPNDKKKPEIAFRLSTDSSGAKWLDVNERTNGTCAIRWIAIKGAGRYRVCTVDNAWLPWVDAYNIKDLENGCAGDGSKITGVEIESSNVAYAVRVLGSTWYPEMHGTHDTGGTGDNFAGDLMNAIDGFWCKAI